MKLTRQMIFASFASGAISLTLQSTYFFSFTKAAIIGSYVGKELDPQNQTYKQTIKTAAINTAKLHAIYAISKTCLNIISDYFFDSNKIENLTPTAFFFVFPMVGSVGAVGGAVEGAIIGAATKYLYNLSLKLTTIEAPAV
jgi:hypothetical protein